MKKYILFISLIFLFSCEEKEINNNHVEFEKKITKKTIEIQTQNLQILGLKSKISDLEKELKKCDNLINIYENDK